MNIGESISVITVFIQGILSFFSPCVLPLLPVYIGTLSGGTVSYDEEGNKVYDRKKVVINTLFFVIGIGFTFFLLGLGIRTVGRFFGSNQLLFARIAGIIVIFFGLYQLGAFRFLKGFEQEKRLPVSLDNMAMSPLKALVMGFLFSFAWTPCIGPVLSSVILMAGSADKGAFGFLLIGIYTLGFAIPFLLTGLFASVLLDFFKEHRSVVKYTEKIGGILLVIMGILMLTGQMNSISSKLSMVNGGTIEKDSDIDADSDINAAGSGTENLGDAGMKDTESGGSDTDDGTEGDSAIDEGAQGSGAESAGALNDGAQDSGSQKDQAEDQSKGDRIPAPDFTLKDQYGNTHSLKDYRGKTVFLNIWATWCPYCTEEMPDIQEIYEESLTGDPDVVILGLAFPDNGGEVSKEEMIDFLDINGFTYPVLMDSEGELISKFYIHSYPMTFLIDKDGNVVFYVPGKMDKQMMYEVIAEASK
ncbi:MAG: redoxin domain-containing protein [Lachnospiraceae bacterium]|nr:redoxin domain-containing protein [Lachnospiraceae bacterium]